MKKEDLIVGGVYAFNSERGFTVSKLIAQDEYAVYVTMYRENFETCPDLNSTEKLSKFIVCTPIDPGGYADGLVFLFHESISVEEKNDFEEQMRLQYGE